MKHSSKICEILGKSVYTFTPQCLCLCVCVLNVSTTRESREVNEMGKKSETNYVNVII